MEPITTSIRVIVDRSVAGYRTRFSIAYAALFVLMGGDAIGPLFRQAVVADAAGTPSLRYTSVMRKVAGDSPTPPPNRNVVNGPASA